MKREKRLFLSPPHMGGTERELVGEVFDSNYVAPVGAMLGRFEGGFSAYTGIPHAVAVASGTAAMHLALILAGVKPGDVVMASDLTFIGSVGPARHMGARLHFIDSDRETWNMDPDLLARALDDEKARGGRVGAVVPTDIYGQCADYDRLEEICAAHGAPLIIDAAESLGATYKGRGAGDAGLCSISSFNGNKIITTSGGGMLASRDAALVERARKLSTQAREDAAHYEHLEVGFNYRMSNVVAAIGVGQMEVLAERVAKKREIFEWYRQTLEHPGIAFMPEAEYGESTRWLTVALLDSEAFPRGPEAVRLALEEANIESRPVWKPMHAQPVFAECPHTGGEVGLDLFARGLCLPSGTAMERRDVEQVAEMIMRCAK